MSRKVAREETMKILFQMEINKDYSDDSMNTYIVEHEFTDDEIEPVKEACERARLAIECIISTGIEQAMSRYNG